MVPHAVVRVTPLLAHGGIIIIIIIITTTTTTTTLLQLAAINLFPQASNPNPKQLIQTRTHINWFKPEDKTIEITSTTVYASRKFRWNSWRVTCDVWRVTCDVWHVTTHPAQPTIHPPPALCLQANRMM